ncbi:MAG TPA: GIY-YIG nuclease family protein [Candidatus Dormibacteraeota bacterium]|nr:GIY-YIG nuclease family protein [Candidatus Dormibacteraeota bacterium]
MSQSFSIRLYVPTGDPKGVRIIQMPGWTGRGVVFPRARLDEASRRDEVRGVGVYVLWQAGEEGSALPRAYVGQSENVAMRIVQHDRGKDFWEHAIVFTNNDLTFNTAHAQYLEAQLLARASKANRSNLVNGNVPQAPDLSEMDRADADSFLENLLLCLPLVGVLFFEEPTIATSVSDDLVLRAKGVAARGVEDSAGFVVRAGSQAVATEVPSVPPSVHAIRSALLEKGVLVVDGPTLRFAQDYPFASPSTAASAVLGSSSNGRELWTDSTGRPLKAIQARLTEVTQ